MAEFVVRAVGRLQRQHFQQKQRQLRLWLRRSWHVEFGRSPQKLSAASISSSSSHSWSSFSTSVPSRVSSLPPSRTLFRSLPHNFRREISSNIQNKEDFRNGVISSHLPVLVAFRAQWCGRSRILAARLEKAVAKQEGRVAMAKVDVDESTDLAVEYGVFALPTVIAVRGGDIVARFEGMKDADQLDSFISKLITSSK